MDRRDRPHLPPVEQSGLGLIKVTNLVRPAAGVLNRHGVRTALVAGHAKTLEKIIEWRGKLALLRSSAGSHMSSDWWPKAPAERNF
jgi:hypothetical protein